MTDVPQAARSSASSQITLDGEDDKPSEKPYPHTSLAIGKMEEELVPGGQVDPTGDRPEEDPLDLHNSVISGTSERHIPMGSSSVVHVNPGRSSAFPLSGPSSFKNSGKHLFRYLNGQQPDRAHREMILNNQDLRSIWISFQYFLVCYAFVSFCLFLGLGRRDSSHLALMLCVRLGYLVFAVAGSVILQRVGKRLKWGLLTSRLSPFFTDIVAVIIFFGFVSSAVSNVAFLPNGSEFWNVFEAFFFVMVLMHMYRTNLQGYVIIIICVLVIVTAVIISGLMEASGALMWECIAYALLMSGTQMLAVQGDPRRHRSEHKAICEEHDRVSQLLDSMLPQEVLAEMKSGRLSTAYHYDDMTFMFADIVGFTSYCAAHTAEEAVNLVTKLFAEFDEATVLLQIYKVCTIGDAYVVVNEPRTKVIDKYADCQKVYRLAEKMIDTIILVRQQVNHQSLDMRIGLHCGWFVGGVIGTTRVRFDIWGEDVLIGNSIESEGLPGRICASNEAKQVLEKCPLGPNLTFSFVKEFLSKNSKRAVQTYVIDNTETAPAAELSS